MIKKNLKNGEMKAIKLTAVFAVCCAVTFCFVINGV